MVELTFGAIFLFVTIFLLGSLSGLMSEKVGVINIAIEGMMTIGAMVYSLVGMEVSGKWGNSSQLFAFLVAGFASGCFGLLYAWAAIKFKAQQVVAGTALNVLAMGFGLFMSRVQKFTPYGAGSGILSNYELIKFFDNTMNIYFVIALALAIGIWFYFRYTKSGLRYIAVGENPQAADAVGINVNKTRYVAVMVSGILAGFAGAVFTHYTANSFQGGVQGFGFISLAILIFGQWRPLIILFASTLFGTLQAVAYMNTIASIPKDIISLLPFVLSMVVLIGLSQWSKAPKALGIPFDKSLR